MVIRQLLAAMVAAAAVLTAITAHAETWRMAHKMPPDSPEGEIFEQFAERVARYTDGRLTIEMYPNGQLGSDDAVLEQLQMGIVDIYAEGFNYMRRWAPELSWTAAPFAFDSYEHWARFMNSDLVDGWFEKAAEQSGVVSLGDPAAIVRGPYRVLVTNRPIHSLADVRGLKLRMNPNRLSIAVWNHLGARIITLPWTDVYQSISKNIVEAVTSPAALVESMRFDEVAPFVARTNEYYQSIGFMTNEDALKALEPDVRQGLLRAYRDTGESSRATMAEVARESFGRMQENGLEYTEIDTQPFVDGARELYRTMSEHGELPEGYLETVEATREDD
jgi:TRAP-type C4-dicarboxylate transport system substrate-binding protein